MSKEEIDIHISDILEQIEDWIELKECYRQEIEMGIDINMNKFLYENCDKEIKKLEQLKNQNNE